MNRVRRLICKYLSPVLPPLFLAPISRMVAAPLLDAFDLARATEVIPIALFTEPPPLAGSFAGSLTRLQRAEPLAPLGSRVRQEQSLAASALTSFGSTAPGAPNLLANRRSRKPKRPEGRRSYAKKEEGICAEKFEEKPPEENGFSNRHFSPAFIPPLTQD